MVRVFNMRHCNLIKITDLAYRLKISAYEVTKVCRQLQIRTIVNKINGTEYISVKAKTLIIQIWKKAESMNVSPFFYLDCMSR